MKKIAITIMFALIFWLDVVFVRWAYPCCTAYVEFAKQAIDCNDFCVVNVFFDDGHTCSGALVFGASGLNGGPAIYAPYGVCDDYDVIRNIADTWLTTYRGCDFSGDGIINFQDYSIMLYLWRKRQSEI